MIAAVILFPGANCDRDMIAALTSVAGRAPATVWHQETRLPDRVDLVALPGGFTYGDYLRPGAIAARAPIMEAVRAHAARGGRVLGVCNGWQILVEAGLLPGVLTRNRRLRFISRLARVAAADLASPFLSGYRPGAPLSLPIAHYDGCFFADEETLARIEGEGRVAFRYLGKRDDPADPDAAPNGSLNNIAGVASADGRVLGMMPHPERAMDAACGSEDGRALFEGALAA